MFFSIVRTTSVITVITVRTVITVHVFDGYFVFVSVEWFLVLLGLPLLLLLLLFMFLMASAIPEAVIWSTFQGTQNSLRCVTWDE